MSEIPRHIEVHFSDDGRLIIVPDLPVELEAAFADIGVVRERACLLEEELPVTTPPATAIER